MTGAAKMLLIGDNPFLGISHLSQERARTRDSANSAAEKAEIVLESVKNGANGFMFSVSEVTLSILRSLREQYAVDKVELHAMLPYAFEYVRIATQLGTPGLARKFAKQIFVSGNFRAMTGGLASVARMNPKGLMETYLTYEISRVRSAAGGKTKLASVSLNEVIADMGLALNFDWLFKSFITYLKQRKITPGFNTRNLCFLTKRFNEWNIDLEDILITAPFNKAGFQMNPSREECEKNLATHRTPTVLAISVLAAGYFSPLDAAEYIAGLDNLKGVVAGASTQQQARELFQTFSKRLNN